MSVLDDWRRQGQENYLKGVTLFFNNYQPYRTGWDHNHCEFCGIKFSLEKDGLKFGYTTKDKYYWICRDCCKDFKDEFLWKVEE
jgi:hypothetical protein